MERIGESELILNADGSVFHLHLLPEDISDTIILVGDQNRVETVSSYFDRIDVKKENREFKTHTGFIGNKRISVVSTGIGTDNIDIVLNELDALVNVDLKERKAKTKLTSLKLVRIGTSGSLQSDIPVDTPVAAKIGIGFDGLLNFYANRNEVCNLDAENRFVDFMKWNPQLAKPYFIEGSAELLNKVAANMVQGFTISAPGFYGPQGRVIRLPIHNPKINEMLPLFNYDGIRINNYEMECSAIYGLSALLGHEALTVCSIIANRARKEYSKDYKVSVKKLIEHVLSSLSQ